MSVSMSTSGRLSLKTGREGARMYNKENEQWGNGRRDSDEGGERCRHGKKVKKDGEKGQQYGSYLTGLSKATKAQEQLHLHSHISRHKSFMDPPISALELTLKRLTPQDLSSTLTSKNKQLTSLHSHASTLQKTILLLKEQINKLSKENQWLVESQGAEEVQIRKEVRYLRKENGRIKQKVAEFQEIVPRLNQLQSMQTSLIEQNRQLKQYKSKVTQTLKQVKTAMVPSGRSKINLKVGKLIDSLLN